MSNKITFLLAFIFATNIGFGQGLQLKEHEENYEEKLIIQDYQGRASKYYKSNLDSAIHVFRDLELKGHEQNNNFIISYALCSIAYLYKLLNKDSAQISTYKDALLYAKELQQLKSEIYINLGVAYLGSGSLDSADFVFNKSRENLLPLQDSTFYVNLLIGEGDVLSLKEQYHSALSKYLAALKFSIQSNQSMKETIINGKIGLMYFQISDTTHALQYLKVCLDKAKNNQFNRLQMNVLLKLGLLYMNQQKFEASKKCFEDVIANKRPNYNKEVFEAYSNLAYLYYSLGEFRDAEVQIEKAAELENSIQRDKDRVAYYQVKGLLYKYNNDIIKARDMYQKIVDIGLQFSSPKTQITGYTGLLDLAEVEKNWSQARQLYEKILDAYQQWNIVGQQNLLYDLQMKYEATQKEMTIQELTSITVLQKDNLLQQKKLSWLYFIALILTTVLIGIFIFNHYRNKKMNALLTQKNEDLNAALKSNKNLLKEIHHRVKNNLQVVSSLLGLQSIYVKDDEAIKAIKTGRSRVQSISLLHQKLYQNGDLQHVNIQDYFENLILNLISTYQINSTKIKLNMDVEEMTLDIDTVVPMGLIINELISNSLKYAFIANDELKLDLSIRKVDPVINMKVQDNGPGTSFDIIPEKTKTLGLQLIKSFVEKLRGEIKIENNNGLAVEINFPFPQSLIDGKK